MLIYFLIWYGLGLLAVMYFVIDEYMRGCEINISIAGILCANLFAVICGGALAVCCVLQVVSGLFDKYFTKSIFVLKRNKK